MNPSTADGSGVLVVDDDPIALEMLARQLAVWEFRVATASNGREALEKFQGGGFSFVISDWQMPELDGLEFLGQVRSTTDGDYVYCILLTVRSQLADLIQGMEAGADDFLTKPFEPAELRVRLRAGQRIIELERRLTLANRRMTEDLKRGARIQQSLLPVRIPALAGSRFAWGYRPCDELGGDILNVLHLAEDKVALYLLDVSGHGVPAALLSVALSRLMTTATNASSLIREKNQGISEGYRIVPPAEVLQRLNERFLQDLEGERFFTILYGILDLDSHELCYASGGHPPALVLSPGGQVRQLAATGIPLGVLGDATFDECTIRLQPGDRLLVYSDGITEAANPAGEQFGLERLIAAFQENPADTIQGALDHLIRRIEQWAQPLGLRDDVSCLAAEAVHSGQ
jgi:sigma-B regulation protein RsbU (phosphoserine phosphatase)